MRISPFLQLLVEAYMILFWSLSAAFMVMAVFSYFSNEPAGYAFLKDHPALWGGFVTTELVLLTCAIGVAVVSSSDAIRVSSCRFTDTGSISTFSRCYTAKKTTTYALRQIPKDVWAQQSWSSFSCSLLL